MPSNTRPLAGLVKASVIELLNGGMLPARLAPYALAYAGYYATVGVLLPYLSAYFEARGFDARTIGLLLSFSPLASTLTPALVGYLADRTGRPRALMRLALAGAALAMFALSFASTPALALACMLGYASFHPPILVLLEAATLHELEARGGVYARVRLFGSLAFVVVAFGAGLALDGAADRGAALAWIPRAASLALLAQLAISARLPTSPRLRAPPDRRAALGLLRTPGLPLLLAASALHWVAMAPYHTLFSLHVHHLGLADSVVGASMAFGATVEIAVMAAAPRLERRLDARRMLLLAFASGVLRWALTGLAREGWAIVAVQALHGLSFGAFYVAAIAELSRRVPSELRATGQGLFFAVVFGLGGAVGTQLAGHVAAAWGGASPFFVSSALSLVVTLAWWRFGAAAARP